MFHDFSRILREMKMVIATMKNMRHDSGIFDTVHRALFSILSFAAIINNPENEDIQKTLRLLFQKDSESSHITLYNSENYVIWDTKSMGMKDINDNSTLSNGTQLQTNVDNKR